MILSHLTSPSKLFFSTFFFLATALAQLLNESLVDNNRILERFFIVAKNVTRAPTWSQGFCVCSWDSYKFLFVFVFAYQLRQHLQVANSKRCLQPIEPACGEITQFLKIVFSLGMRGELHYFKICTWRETCKPAQTEKICIFLKWDNVL